MVSSENFCRIFLSVYTKFHTYVLCLRSLHNKGQYTGGDSEMLEFLFMNWKEGRNIHGQYGTGGSTIAPRQRKISLILCLGGWYREYDGIKAGQDR